MYKNVATCWKILTLFQQVNQLKLNQLYDLSQNVQCCYHIVRLSDMHGRSKVFSCAVVVEKVFSYNLFAMLSHYKDE